MNISATFQALEDELSQLNKVLLSKSPLYARVCVIPPIADGEENLELNHISPQLFVDHMAIIEAQKNYRDLHIKTGLSQKAARRSAGVLWYDDNSVDFTQKVVAHIERINFLKQSIQEYIIRTFETQYARFQALHQACPGVMTLHLYRQLRLWHNHNIESVRFSWQQKSLISIPDKNKLLSRMGDYGQLLPDHQKQPLAQLAQLVASVPQENLRLRRPAKIQPVANIKFRDQVAPNGSILKTVTAPMPYIIIQSELIDIKPLQVFRPKNIQRLKDKLPSKELGNFHGEKIEMIITQE